MVQISQVESIRARAADGLTIRDKSCGTGFYVKNAWFVTTVNRVESGRLFSEQSIAWVSAQVMSIRVIAPSFRVLNMAAS